MDYNNNGYYRTERPRNRRRMPNLRPPVSPYSRSPLLQNQRIPLLPNSPAPTSNFRAQRENWRAQPENWRAQPENWPHASQYWRQSEYWRRLPYENWPAPSQNWRHTMQYWPPLTGDRRSVLLSNGGQTPIIVLDQMNSRSENAVSSTVSTPLTDPEDPNNPDVVYLYSVDTSAEGHFAEVLDLTVDSEVSSTLTETSSSQLEKEKPQPEKEKPQPEKVSKSRKRKLSDSPDKTEKRPRKDLGQPCCSFCQAQYDELRERNQFLFAARCGHTFCRSCTSANGIRRPCNICKTQIGSLYKIFL